MEATDVRGAPRRSSRFVSLFRLAALSLAALPIFAQDSVLTALQKVETSGVNWGNILLILGMMVLGGRYIWVKNHDHADTWSYVIGGVLMVTARVLAPYLIPTQ